MKFYKYRTGFGIRGGILWFRISGYGLHFQNLRRNPLIMMSEQNGAVRYIVIFGIKIKVLKRDIF